MLGGARGLVLASLLLVTVAYASDVPKEWTLYDFPNPQRDFDLCNMDGVSSVCNPDRVLSADAASQVSEWIGRIHQEAKDECGSAGKLGYQVAVAVVEKMNCEGKSPEDAATNFAKGLIDMWGVGYAACNNGIVLFVSKLDRIVHIATGSGAKHTLTESAIDDVIDIMIPHLKNGDFDSATTAALERMHDVLMSKIAMSKYIMWPIYAFFGAIILFFTIKGNRTTQQYTRCTRLLANINAAAKEDKFDVKTCPICLEDFTPKTVTEILPCGHKFCQACLSRWLQTSGSNRACPICRADAEDGSPQDAPRQRVRFTRSMSSVHTRDIYFRLFMLHNMYPRYVTTDMARGWAQNPHLDFHRDTAFTGRNPNRATGRSGSGRHSFGGGHSHGGGGHGRGF